MNHTPEENDDDLDAWFGKIERPRPSHCPECGTENVKQIIYGLPMEVDPTPAEERDYVLGGCRLRENSPGWYCGACRHKW